MSRPHKIPEPPKAGTSTDQDSDLKGAHNVFDGAGDIFSRYLVIIEEEDKKIVEGWKAEADGILIFTGLFSAAVSTLISVSIQDIRPNPQDTSNFYLANISRALADPNQSNISSSLLSDPPKFSPPTYAVLVNLLWFMSLVISLICALLATLLQQWARKYIGVTQPHFSPHKRARVQAFFAGGVETLHLPRAVQVLPTLLHLSLFLFLVGVVVFLCHVNSTIFGLVLPWVCICAVLYGCTTFMPIFRHDSPYYTPLSSSMWFIVNGIAFVVLRAFRPASFRNNEVFEELEERYRQSLLQGMQKTINKTAQNSPSSVGGRVLIRALDTLENDDELELFFMGMPGFRSFRNSKVAADPLLSLTRLEQRRLFEELLDLMDRTFSSDLLTEKAKNWRATICMEAINPADISGAFRWILDRILTDGRYDGLKTAEFGHILRRWGNGANKRAAIIAQTIASVILVRVRKRNACWVALATEQLDVSESVLGGYAESDVSLASFIHIIRGLLSLLCEGPPLGFGRILLEAVSKFDIQEASPELLQDFCALWNEIVARSGPLDAQEILKWIRNVYITLHKDTDAAPPPFSEPTNDLVWILDTPSWYPRCNIPDHHPHLTSSTAPIHNVSTLTTFTGVVLRDNTPLAPAPIFSSLDAPSPSSSVLTPSLVDQSPPMDVPLPDHHSFVPVHPAHLTTVEDHHIPATSPDPTTANAAQGGIVTSPRTLPRSTSETLTPVPPLASTLPPSVVTLRHNADPLTSLDAPDFLPSIPGPENIFPTDPPSFPEPPVTGSDHPHSLLKSHPSMLATTPPETPQPTSVPGLDAAAGGEGVTKAILLKNKVQRRSSWPPFGGSP